MTTHDLDKVIAAAKDVGAYRYINRAAKDEPTHTFTVEQLEAFYAIAHEDGRQAEREGCIGIVESYRVSVGNSRSGELACEWTMENLREIRDAIRARSTK